MVLQAAAPNYSSAKDAKHLLDMIGEDVYKEVKNESETYKDELKGNLQHAKGIEELVSTNKTCDLLKQYYENVNGGSGNGERHPCGNTTGKDEVPRFSDTLGGQCTKEKISGSTNTCGACAPYRRLNLCDQNMEKMSTNNYDSSNAKHNLLAEVCLAAQFEAESLIPYHAKHHTDGTGSTICTELARSFADIGDIIRGKDLYHGYDSDEKARRDKLDENLKAIFKEIHEDVMNTRGRNGPALKARYKGDEANDFFQLREDWWNANRKEVWKALTCDDDNKLTNAGYFRGTCDDNGTPSRAMHQCRCKKKDNTLDDQVPTYFDYVPQYLRWFEEWAEDFCRLRKRKLEDAKKKCRTPNGKPKYCDLNRHDCVQTIRGEHVFVQDDECYNCSVACAHFVKWIDDQKLEFDKQKKKYTKEMKKYTNGGGGSGGRKKRSTKNETYENYEKKFYDKLKGGYSDVEAFLELLNNEATCKNKLNNEGGEINFKNVNSGSDKNSGGGDDSNKTFYRTKYCEACPWCGAQNKSSGGSGWEPKGDNRCNPGKGYADYVETEIPILTGDKKKGDMIKKYKNFCAPRTTDGEKGDNGQKVSTGTVASGDNSDNATTGYCGGTSDSSLCEKWICYYKEKENNHGKGAINFCVLKDNKVNTKDENSMHYNSFFWIWVYHMLHDSLEWRNQLGSCINNNTNDNTCTNHNKCNKDCGCFQKWVQHKQQEWDAIKKHFKKQKDIDEQTGCNPFVTLELLLDLKQLLENIKESYVNANEKERIEKMLKQAGVGGSVASVSGVDGALGALGGGRVKCNEDAKGKQNTKIDKFLQEELEEAETCKNCQPKKFKNPCSGNTSGDNTKQYEAVAASVAYQMKQKEHEKMKENSVDKNGEVKDGKSVLEADASQGEYNGGGDGSALAGGNICSINEKKHSNRDTIKAQNVCNNKGEGFDIGTKWTNVKPERTIFNHVYMPPRRQHFCTSNLEHLNTNANGLTGANASHSLLGDVLLSANKQAEWIKNKYNEGKKVQHNNKSGLTNEKTVCRAVRRSFADIGDIIRGRDLWDNDNGEINTQNNLVKIFSKIKDKLPEEVKGKYANDNERTIPPYKQLREDWWEANRDQVWKAMQCSLKDVRTSEGDCKYKRGDSVPLDDYIPQRLRWMTEWAEWYCKYQSKEYGELEEQCGGCIGKGKGGGKDCMKGDHECKECTKACTTYKTKIDTWKPQWSQMQMKYTQLYSQAESNSSNAYPDADRDYKQMLVFFKELQEEYDKTATSSSTTVSPYKTAAGYIHQELPYTECNVQREFCDKKNGVTSPSDAKEVNEKYAFKTPPHGYEDACNCKENTAPSSPGRALDNPPDRPPVGPNHDDTHHSDESDDELSDSVEESGGEEEDHDVSHVDEDDSTVQEETVPSQEDPNVCKIVEELFTRGNFDDACSQKYAGINPRLGWKCIPTTKPGEKTTSDSNGAVCIPPRRRKLYIGRLTQWAKEQMGQTQNKGEDGKVDGKAAGSAKPNDQAVVSSESPQPNSNTTQASTSSPSSSDNGLLAAFVESSAVETFFLWHQYKQLHGKPQEDGGLLQIPSVPPAVGGVPGAGGMAGIGGGLGPGSFGPMGLQAAPGPHGEPADDLEDGKGLGEDPSANFSRPPGTSIFSSSKNSPDDEPQTGLLNLGDLAKLSGVEQTPETLLSSGKIPPDFLRQMFYTIADYRDILVGNVPDGIDEVIVSASGSGKDKDGDASGKETDMQKIRNAIDEFLKKQSGNPENSVKTITETQPSDKQLRENFWTKHGKDIWNGMICALTYEEKSGSITENKEVRENLWDEASNKPKSNAGPEKRDYTYENVKLDEDTGGERKSNDALKTIETTLKNFVVRPPYFRYLEEWGETFCRERSKRLAQIQVDCTQDDKPCSSYGENCENIRKQDYDTISNFKCPRCGKSCRFYRKWIERKKEEFIKQSNAYGEQKTKCQTESKKGGGVNGFCGKLKTNCDKAKDFLKTLASCKKDENESGQGKKGEGKTVFDNEPDETFKDADNCKPCSQFKINCKNGNCKGGTNNTCTNTTFKVPDDIKNEEDSTVLDMLVSDDSKSGNKFETVLPECKDADIFEGIRKEEWKCGYFCGVDMCEQTNFNGKQSDKEYIQIRALLAHWVYNFLEDYNRIRKKLKPCMNNGKEFTCQNKCKDKCNCVEHWITKKRGEWETIRKRYLDQYKSVQLDNVYKVKSFLEDSQFYTEVQKVKGNHKSLTDFESKVCNCTKSSKKKAEDYDLVKCLLDKLDEKAQTYLSSASVDTPSTCDNSPLSGKESTHVEDDDPLEEEENQDQNQKGKQAPGFCEIKEQAEEEQTEETCEEASTTKEPASTTPKKPAPTTPKEISPENSGGTEANPEQTPVLKPEEEAPAPEQAAPKPAPKEDKKQKQQRPQRPRRRNPRQVEQPHLSKPLFDAMLYNTLAWSIGIGITGLSYWFLKKKTKRPVDILSVMEIPQNDYDIPTLKSKNRYIPYKSAQYKGKTYLYVEGDTDEEKYMFMSDTSDITSSESEYEEFDINDIYPYQSPKYKTLIEVVLEPSKRDTQNDIPSSDTPSNKFTDNEWNTLKDEFISQYLPNIQPNDYKSGNSPTNTNNTTMSRHTLDQKPFIMSIHDRNLYTGEEYNYDMSSNSGNNDLYGDIYTRSGDNVSYSGTKSPISDNHDSHSDIDPTSVNRDSYSGKNSPYSGNLDSYTGTDLINDSLNSGNHDIYNELLKRKENELFGTNHVKHTSTHNVASPTNSDPIMNQLDLFHKWLDRHRNMYEQWENHHELLAKLKEKWDNETHSGNKHSDIPSDNIHSDNIPSDHTLSSKKTLNSDVSIQIDMNNPKTTNEFTYVDSNPDNSSMDTILEDLDKYNEPYYDVQDDIYYDVNDHDVSTMESNPIDVPSNVQIELDVNNHKVVKEKYPIGDVWDI
ncbi:erythrocyte membrane protein 1, EMP1 [Plasmodium reichenowi]|uniref:Erythrocyte membrane protein 1, EMP1 n=1 Tax=Plasmodium reichenowi TaxID=5854 RepID=A0A060RWG6_PLARE|nr:erythrocyte membrane protein 1, EMP1 [Plasmodium reichenowi]